MIYIYICGRRKAGGRKADDMAKGGDSMAMGDV